MSDPTIKAAKRRLSRELLQNPRVSGVGIEGDQIKVYLADDDPELASSIPTDVDGHPVLIEVLGTITVQVTQATTTSDQSAATAATNDNDCE